MACSTCRSDQETAIRGNTQNRRDSNFSDGEETLCHATFQSFLPNRHSKGRPTIYGIDEIISFMKEPAVRTTVDIPASLYRKLKVLAAAQGRSVRELILLGVRITLVQGKHPRSRSVKFPMIVSDGPKVDLTNEQIYEHLEFP